MKNDAKPGFTQSVLERIAAARSTRIEGPNRDTWRFPNPPRQRFGLKDRTKMQEFLSERRGELDEVARLYRDDASRDLFRDLLAFRMLGYDHIRLPTNRPAYFAAYDRARAWMSARSEREVPPFELAIYDGVEFMDARLCVECWLGNVVFSFLLKQYFFERGGVRVQPEPGETVIDAGACFGDTALAFAVAAGAAGRVISFEPMPAHREILAGNLARNPGLAGRIACEPFAVSDVSDRTLLFSSAGAGSRAAETGSVPVRTITIDDYVRRRGLDRVDFIKMDIESSEFEALQGAADTIARFRPKLAISVYHGLRDYLRIPKLLHEMAPFYALYLDHYTLHWEETILYCLPESG